MRSVFFKYEYIQEWGSIGVSLQKVAIRGIELHVVRAIVSARSVYPEVRIKIRENPLNGGFVAAVHDYVGVIVPGDPSVVTVGSDEGAPEDEVADVGGRHRLVENPQHLLEHDRVLDSHGHSESAQFWIVCVDPGWIVCVVPGRGTGMRDCLR